MIKRHNLAEQLREYQIRSKHDWASAAFFSSTSHNNFTSRMDVMIFVIWELIILAFLVSSAVSLYFRHMQLAFGLICVMLLMLLCMKVTKQIRQARKKKRRMLLPCLCNVLKITLSVKMLDWITISFVNFLLLFLDLRLQVCRGRLVDRIIA